MSRTKLHTLGITFVLICTAYALFTNNTSVNATDKNTDVVAVQNQDERTLEIFADALQETAMTLSETFEETEDVISAAIDATDIDSTTAIALDAATVSAIEPATGDAPTEDTTE